MRKAWLILRRCCLGGDLDFGFKHISLAPFSCYGTDMAHKLLHLSPGLSPAQHFMDAFVVAAAGCETLHMRLVLYFPFTTGECDYQVTH